MKEFIWRISSCIARLEIEKKTIFFYEMKIMLPVPEAFLKTILLW